jgi:hypothetical protein
MPGRRRGRAHRRHPSSRTHRRTHRRRRLTRTRTMEAPSASARQAGEVNVPRGWTDRADFGLTGMPGWGAPQPGISLAAPTSPGAVPVISIPLTLS